MSLVGLLVFVIILGLVLYLVQLLLADLPIAEPFRTIAYVLVILIAIIVLLDQVGWLGGIGAHCGRLVC